LVGRTKEGNFSRYEIADEGVFELCERVCGGLRRQLDELAAVLPGSAGERWARSRHPLGVTPRRGASAA